MECLSRENPAKNFAEYPWVPNPENPCSVQLERSLLIYLFPTWRDGFSRRLQAVGWGWSMCRFVFCLSLYVCPCVLFNVYLPTYVTCRVIEYFPSSDCYHCFVHSLFESLSVLSNLFFLLLGRTLTFSHSSPHSVLLWSFAPVTPYSLNTPLLSHWKDDFLSSKAPVGGIRSHTACLPSIRVYPFRELHNLCSVCQGANMCGASLRHI